MDTDKYPIYVTDWKISGAFKQLRGFLRQQELCSESGPLPAGGCSDGLDR